MTRVALFLQAEDFVLDSENVHQGYTKCSSPSRLFLSPLYLCNLTRITSASGEKETLIKESHRPVQQSVITSLTPPDSDSMSCCEDIKMNFVISS